MAGIPLITVMMENRGPMPQRVIRLVPQKPKHITRFFIVIDSDFLSMIGNYRQVILRNRHLVSLRLGQYHGLGPTARIFYYRIFLKAVIHLFFSGLIPLMVGMRPTIKVAS